MKSIDEACSDPATQHDILGYFDLGLYGTLGSGSEFQQSSLELFHQCSNRCTQNEEEYPKKFNLLF